MAKDKVKKQSRKPTSAKKAKPLRAKPASPRVQKKAAPRVNAAVRQAGKKAQAIAANPAVAEIVAASLVAAAAAIKNPKKARDIATAVGDELESASKQAVDRGNAFWQLAIDIARRSMEALGAEKSAAKSKRGTKKKSKK